MLDWAISPVRNEIPSPSARAIESGFLQCGDPLLEFHPVTEAAEDVPKLRVDSELGGRAVEELLEAVRWHLRGSHSLANKSAGLRNECAAVRK